MKGKTQHSGQANELSVVQMLVWSFKHVKRLINTALHYFSCSMQTNHSLASTGHTTQYTVSACYAVKVFQNQSN
jgi:hypothetical protein